MSSFADRMARMAGTDAFKAAKEAAKTSGFSSGVPDGDYIAVPVKAAWDESKPGKELVKWAFLILHDKQGDTTFANKTAYDNSRFETDENVGYFLKRVHTFGYDIDDYVEAAGEDRADKWVKEFCEDVVSNKPQIEITLKTKGEYQNTYVNRLVDDSTPTPYEPVADAPTPPATAPATVPATAAPAEPARRGRRRTTEAPAAAPEPAPNAPDAGEVDLVPGVRLAWKSKSGEARTGEIVETNETAGTLVMLRDDNGEKAKITTDQITGLADAPGSSEPAEEEIPED